MSSPRWPSFSCGSASLLRLPCCDGLVHAVMDAEDLRQPGDPEDLEYALLRAHQVQRAIVGTHALEPANEHAQAGGVEELHLLHVHHELVVAVVDQVNEKLTQPRGGIDVDLSLDVDNLDPVRRVMLQLQVHKSSRIMRSLLFSRHALTCRHLCPSLRAPAPRRALNHALTSCLHEFTLRGIPPTDSAPELTPSVSSPPPVRPLVPVGGEQRKRAWLRAAQPRRRTSPARTRRRASRSRPSRTRSSAPAL